MNSIHRFRFPDTVFNSVGRVVALNSNHGVIEFHIGELNAGFALFYLDDFYIHNRAIISGLNEVHSFLRNNLHVHFDANHILFHPSLKNETKELPKILNVFYITSKVWIGLRPSVKNEHQPKLNAVNVLKTILPCVFKLSISEKLNYHYDLKSSNPENLQISLSDAVACVVEIVSNESGVLKISANNLFTYAIFNINILYIDGIKCDSSRCLKEFVTAGMKLHCNAKRMNNTFGNYVVTCVWSGIKPTALDVFNNIISNYTHDLKLISNVVYVGIVLQLHPPDFALLVTSDSQHVSYVILYIGNFRLSETQPFIHKGSWIDDFLDLSDILFFKVDAKQNGVFSFALDAWFPDILEINGYTYMVFDDMVLRKSLSWIDKEYNRITNHAAQKTNVKSCKILEHISRKLHRRVNKPMPKCAKLPPISENDETTDNFCSPSIEDKDINLLIRPTICNDKFQIESKSNTEIGSSPNLETHESGIDETSNDCGNFIKNKVTKINCLKNTEATPLSMFWMEESNSKQSSDLSVSTSHARNVKLLLNKSDKIISSELYSKQLFSNCKQAVLVNQPLLYNSTTHEPQLVNKLNSQENNYNDFEENSRNCKQVIYSKKVRFSIDSSENNEENILVQDSTTSINEPSCDFKDCKHNKPGKENFTLSCGTFSSLVSPITGYLEIQPNLKILFDINVLYKYGKPCDISHKLLDHITIGQKLNYIVSTLAPYKHVAWGVWYGSEVPDDIHFIKSLLLLPNEKLEILANNALYYATVVKLSPPIGALLLVQNQRQLIPVVLLAENLYCDDTGHQTITCMMDHLLVGDSVEVKVKKRSFHCLQNNYFYWEAAEAWKRMPYATELFNRKTMALKGPYYLHSLEDSKKKKKIFSSKLGDPQHEISKQVIISEKEDNFSEELSDLEKPLDVHQNKTEDEVFYCVDNEKMIVNRRGTQVDLESFHKSNGSSNVIDQLQSEVLSVPAATNKNTSVNEIQSLKKINGIVESVCCWYAIIMFQYCDNTERAICYKNSIALQTSSPLEQILRVGISVAFNIEHMKEPNMGSNYRAINVCIVSSLNDGNPVETHYNKLENSFKNWDSKSVSRYLETNHKIFTYFRNQSGIVKYILSDDEGVVECEIRGVCLHLRFKNDVFQPQHHPKDTNLNRYLRSGLEVCFDAKLLNHDKMSNSNVKIISIWKRNNLIEDSFYKAKVVELRLPFAFVAQVYEEKIFVFNRYFRSQGEGSIKLAANQPIKNFVCVGSEVKVLVQRNKTQTSDKLYQFAWTAKDCWLLKK